MVNKYEGSTAEYVPYPYEFVSTADPQEMVILETPLPMEARTHVCDYCPCCYRCKECGQQCVVPQLAYDTVSVPLGTGDDLSQPPNGDPVGGDKCQEV
jgi:hypothetical protein